MKVQLLSHATMLVTISDKKLLVDPMLSQADIMPPIRNSPKQVKNPLVALSTPLDLLEEIDAVLLTHTHSDHFDEAAIRQIPKSKPMICQAEDEHELKNLGFLAVQSVQDKFCWEKIMIHRTGGQHGTGEIGLQMAPVSGYVLEAEEEPSLYIAGDTIYCRNVSDVLVHYQPEVIVVNAGGARFNTGDPITMTAQDVAKVCRAAPKSRIIAVHMDAINHCLVSRNDLSRYLRQEGLIKHVMIPQDGEQLNF